MSMRTELHGYGSRNENYRGGIMDEGKTVQVTMSTHKWNILLKILEHMMRIFPRSDWGFLRSDILDLYQDIYYQVHGVKTEFVKE